jgi:thioredoxin-related protein
MKNFILSIFLLLFISSSSLFAQTEIQWLTFEQAVEKTKNEPKMVLVDVYTDWCGWCKKMDKETFQDAKVIQYINENFYPVKLNAEDTKSTFKFRGKAYTSASMAKAMRVTSYPNFVIMDAGMENITQLPGYRPTDAFLSGVETLVKTFAK